MVDVRTLLAALLGVGLGLACLLSPETILRAQTVGRMPRDRGGEYGTDGSFPATWVRLVRGVGVALLLAGGYFGTTLL